jgi:hypothetical protein
MGPRIGKQHRSPARLGRQIPEDLGVAFFHQERLSRRHSGLEVHAGEVGRTAGALLMRLIETNERGVPRTPATTPVSSLTWRDGQTLRAPRSRSRR